MVNSIPCNQGKGGAMSVILLVGLVALLVVVDSFSVHSGHHKCPKAWTGIPGSFTMLTSVAPTSETPISTESVVLPGESFRATSLGELSVTSCNVLAPTYHALAIYDLEERQKFCTQDRDERFPLAIKMAKQSNADILLLQEVEGGPQFEPKLRKLLREPISETISGYDSCMWAPLLPNKSDHVVGLCVAWRSSRHRLVAADGYKRGMACMFSEVRDEGDCGTFGIANVHLPARPSNIIGRLVTMSKTIQRLANYDVSQRKSPLDGLLVVGGDWNCDHKSVAAKLLTDGKVHYGNVRDRNYKANISKPVASRMRHGYRFRDVYSESVRDSYAPVTVSLHGRGPGTMDHIFYTQTEKGPSKNANNSITKTVKLNNSQKGRVPMSKRKLRREKATRMRRAGRGSGSFRGSFAGNVGVESVLGTVTGKEDQDRLDLINAGLPNVAAGLPSDHLPVGVLFVPQADFSSKTDNCFADGDSETNQDGLSLSTSSIGGVTSSVRRRREAGLQSLSTRRRHNVVLRCIADWLEDCGVTEIIRDQPLYKNIWTKDAKDLTKKSRAPDIVCRIHNTLVVIEITVVAAPKVEAIVKRKFDKYIDLPDRLLDSPSVKEAGLEVGQPQVIVLDEMGRVPETTLNSIRSLAGLLRPGDENAAATEAQRCHQQLLSLF
eukprot:CAMPEP_0176174170 /NCGR_PEP_ID=MMETSP0120_2-20121206/89236_1 /TAXON_ID=160619 /ORGANISM="Kryptoperidinium foliaceum, Strain CCMP 1326" /LENGTH=662 /DNA_ID=CAMNT_0017512205 /DNA_START=120 /DNA_END=2108 /DNA_ORIENTATION=+